MNTTTKRKHAAIRYPESDGFFGGAIVAENGKNRALTRAMVEEILDKMTMSAAKYRPLR